MSAYLVSGPLGNLHDAKPDTGRERNRALTSRAGGGCSSQARAQRVAVDPRFRGETTVDVIEVPVWVFERETGRSVNGLASSDFRLREGGREQEISHFRKVVRDHRRPTVS